MTILVLLLLVLSSAVAADEPSADTGDICRVSSHRMAQDRMTDRMAAAKQGRQNFMFVKENKKSIDARETHKMWFLRYLKKKQMAAKVIWALIKD